ncbi:MAG: amino acid permease [Nitrospiraceae bacterium]|nr:amino acid permease [Nitrospiraceae bacterium]
MDKQKNSKKDLGVFLLSMIGVAAVLSIRNIPSMAELGPVSIFYWVLAAITILIPVSFISGELSTAWPKNGGFAVWTKEALGERWGFTTSWIYWLANVIWLPTVLSFTAATIAYIFLPSLANNHIYMMGMILIILWGGTFVNFLRVKISGLVSSIGVILGTIIPGVVLIVMGLIWVAAGHPSQIHFSASNMLPNFGHLGTIEFAAAALLSYVGIELLGVYANHVKNPRRTYPRAILIAVSIILFIYIIATLAVAAVVPQAKLSLVAGLMQAFEAFFGQYNMAWIVPSLAALTAIGAIALINTWILGPAKAFGVTAKDGVLPPILQRHNKNEAPVSILVLQAAIGSVLAIPFVLLPSINESYWILTASTTQLYAVVYMLMFASFLRLRYTRPDVPRPYKVPGGKTGMWIVTILGFGGSLFALIIGFFPPSGIGVTTPIIYESFMLISFATYILLPFVIYHFRRDSWKPKGQNTLAEED